MLQTIPLDFQGEYRPIFNNTTHISAAFFWSTRTLILDNEKCMLIFFPFAANFQGTRHLFLSSLPEILHVPKFCCSSLSTCVFIRISSVHV